MFLTKMYHQIHQCVSRYEFSTTYGSRWLCPLMCCMYFRNLRVWGHKAATRTAGLCQMTADVTCRVSTTVVINRFIGSTQENMRPMNRSLSSLTQAIFKTLTLHNKNMKTWRLWRYRPAPIPLIPTKVKALKVTLQLLLIVLAREKTSMKITHITEGRMYASEGEIS